MSDILKIGDRVEKTGKTTDQTVGRQGKIIDTEITAYRVLVNWDTETDGKTMNTRTWLSPRYLKLI